MSSNFAGSAIFALRERPQVVAAIAAALEPHRAEKMAWLSQTGWRDSMGIPEDQLHQFAAELAEPSGWRELRDAIESS